MHPCEVCGTPTDLVCVDCFAIHRTRVPLRAVCGQIDCHRVHETTRGCNIDERSPEA